MYNVASTYIHAMTYVEQSPIFMKWPRPFIRLYSEQNVDNFKQALEGTEWNQLLHNGDVDICNEGYYDHIN